MCEMGQNNAKITSKLPYGCDTVAKVVAPRPGVQEVVLLAVQVPKVAVKACAQHSGKNVFFWSPWIVHTTGSHVCQSAWGVSTNLSPSLACMGRIGAEIFVRNGRGQSK